MSAFPHHIALLGAGTIGLSMAALHLRRPDTKVTIYDPAPNFEAQLRAQLPAYLDASIPETTTHPKNPIDALFTSARLSLAVSIADAVRSATIIQEQSPENQPSKQAVWQEVARVADAGAHLWSSSSGIPASAQAARCGPDVADRLLVAHPFNPPHLMPVVEIVPSPSTKPERVDFARGYFLNAPGPASVMADGPSIQGCAGPAQQRNRPHYRPVTLHKEIPGFVGNRLAFAMLREACYLVGEGVVSARELDAIVTASVGPRWAGNGVFESYHAGGGPGGIDAFLTKLGPTIEDVWGSLGQIPLRKEGGGQEAWRETVVRQTQEAYGPTASADTKKEMAVMVKGVVEMQNQCWKETK
ncbi:Dehydrogenase multihelical [Penicillium capsulatum]|uniref:L-gulonate 3-dehydrogenase n=1 Tax=Penicillium capsulatum TaxID=69766 RepID=A0A9W9LLB3_9EURO|nr:Dehydrogenase multihelical [Penicillium capsulatum]KAJ6116885.1 Dehydrogenase multihelical [Penicillium capsulatum]